MNLIDADKFLSYLIFSKHIDSLNCGEVKEAVEMCKVDVLDKIRAKNKGEWVFYDEEFYQQGRFASVHHRIRECSICHHKIADFVGNMNFCPNCGADMKGEADGK